MDFLSLGAIIFGCAVILFAMRRYFSPRGTKLPKLPETWWTPGTESSANNDIRPFKVTFTEEDVAWNYGTNTDALRKFLDHWSNNYNFEERERYINQYSHFKTNIQGLDIHFIHVKPSTTEGKRVLPLLIVHGWSGSIMEFYKIIPFLTSPKPEYDFIFEVVAPSLPGFGFSSAATIPELSALHMSVVLKNLMLRLGHDKYYVQGGDWGASVIHAMSCLYPQHVLGMHSNLCLVLNKWNFLKSALRLSSFLPWAKTKKAVGFDGFGLLAETGYFHIQATKPDTVGVGLNDSPAGLAAYIIEKFSTGTNPSYKKRADGGFLEKFTYDELIDNLMIYWVSNSITTAMRIYAELFTKSNWSLLTLLESYVIVIANCSYYCSVTNHKYQASFSLQNADKGSQRLRAVSPRNHGTKSKGIETTICESFARYQNASRWPFCGIRRTRITRRRDMELCQRDGEVEQEAQRNSLKAVTKGGSERVRTSPETSSEIRFLYLRHGGSVPDLQGGYFPPVKATPHQPANPSTTHPAPT
ncbi:Epoxide hydrolase [Temnothorax longispinosus]|uniref:Epoxide hydrolase n=1 Tax=Temnothorax longispinosus TaxID=300112 RepID=A0A4S2KW95_9HYME|nr:Epoxide hydrolase [Temnothorax longispinosus]